MAADEPDINTASDALQDKAAESSTEPAVSPEKLKEILERHRTWVESEDYKKWIEAPSGDKAKYENGRANLQWARLEKADLQRARLKHANPEGRVGHWRSPGAALERFDARVSGTRCSAIATGA